MDTTLSIPMSRITPQPLQASKWLQTQVLMDSQEMEHLLGSLEAFSIFLTGQITKKGEGEISKKDFLEKYSEYIETLKRGQVPDHHLYRSFFSAVFTVTPKAIFSIPVEATKEILRFCLPVIQLQYHRMGYSPLDQKFRPSVFGADSTHWGIQFSYPQLIQDPSTGKIEQIHQSDQFHNTSLFKQLQKWMRQYTVPTPFLVGGTKINVPIRLGKKCFSWINNHPQLSEKNIAVTNIVEVTQ